MGGSANGLIEPYIAGTMVRSNVPGILEKQIICHQTVFNVLQGGAFAGCTSCSAKGRKVLLYPPKPATNGSICPPAGWVGEVISVVIDIHDESRGQLFLIVDAVGLRGLELGMRQHGQQDGSQDGDDGDDYQQFN